MKKTKILVPALAVLALGMAASVTGTVAWFAANNVVNANGMQIQSTTPASLAISETIATTGIGKATSINYEARTNIMNPCSHFHGVEANDGSLYTVSNGSDIDPETGLAMVFDEDNGLGVDSVNNNNTATATPDGYRDLTYVAATKEQDNFVDYVCYLASVGDAITIGTGGSLKVKLNWSTPNQTTKAATVDFWVNAGASTSNKGLGSYKGTLNAVHELASAGHAGAPSTTPYEATTTEGENVTEVTLLNAGGYIPINTNDAAIQVTMRIYLDGALLETEGNTYVTTNSVVLDGIGIDAVFTLSRGN